MGEPKLYGMVQEVVKGALAEHIRERLAGDEDTQAKLRELAQQAIQKAVNEVPDQSLAFAFVTAAAGYWRTGDER